MVGYTLILDPVNHARLTPKEGLCMPVFLPTKKGTIVTKNLLTNLVEGASLEPLDDTLYALGLQAKNATCFLDKDGAPLESGVVEAGKLITIKFGDATARHYHIMVVAHPELARSGQLGGVQLVEPWTTESLEFVFKAYKKVDLLNLPYLFRIYLLD